MLRARPKATGIPSLIGVARARGYEINAEDIQQYVRSQGQEISSRSQELTDEQLESIVGGEWLLSGGIPHAILGFKA